VLIHRHRLLVRRPLGLQLLLGWLQALGQSLRVLKVLRLALVRLRVLLLRRFHRACCSPWCCGQTKAPPVRAGLVIVES